jgi:hypothetical protein
MSFLLENLYFRQAKGWMMVDSISTDYNDSVLAKNMFRIKKGDSDTQDKKGDDKYAVYFEGMKS